MAKGNLDLDRSLDDIIKRSKMQPTTNKPGKPSRPVPSRGRSTSGGRGGIQHHESSIRVSKPMIHRNSNNLNSRGGSGGGAAAINRRIGSNVQDSKPINARSNRVVRGGIVKRERGEPVIKRGGSAVAVGRRGEGDEQKHIDPKELVITKEIHPTKLISPRVAKVKKTASGETLIIQSTIVHNNHQQPPQSNRQTRQQQNQQNEPQQNYQQQQPSYPGYQQQHQQPYNNNNTPSSYQQQRPAQRNIVLICNLDPRATAEDVGEACSVFGPILSCDILLDPMGRPLDEAEIEFLYSNSAEQCVSKLDNGMADGRVLRARLQSSATLPVVPRYSSRTVIASARVAQGGFNNNSQSPPPQQHPIMQTNHHHYHHHNNNRNQQYSSSYHQSRHHPQQYQRRL